MYVKADSVYIEEIPSSVAKKMIIEKHYTHAFSMCRYALGIYYVGEDDHKFYDEKEKKLIGCMTYGYPVGRSAVKSMLPTLEKEEVLELTRLYIHDGYGKNIESLALGKSFDWLKRNASHIKALISYSDPKVSHKGTIYQATNWIYQGNKIRPNDSSTADNVWRTIQYPVLEKYISGKDLDEINYIETKEKSDYYIEDADSDADIALREFHNYIKDKLI